MQNKHRHLEFIQGVIDRNASSVLLLRGWSISLIAILSVMVIVTRGADLSIRVPIITIMVGSLLVFWILDGLFLSRTRLSKALYDEVRVREDADVDFSMDVSRYRENRRNGWARSIFSRALIIFYALLLFLAVIVIAVSAVWG